MQNLQSLRGDYLQRPNIKHLLDRCRMGIRVHTEGKTTGVSPLANPQAYNKLRQELNRGELLGKASDGKHIYLCSFPKVSPLLREIGRLRELTFRAVGEGTGKALDIDHYDKAYRHIVLWDEAEREIVGAYRIGEAFQMPEEDRHAQLYTTELFDYGHTLESRLDQSIELGRSFIQPKYWTRRGLDLLWQGIGHYLQSHPDVRFLYGAVSISNDLPEIAKQHIVACYKTHYQPQEFKRFAKAKLPFRSERTILESHRGKSWKQSTAYLKMQLARQGVTLPPLYKHYADLCDTEGTLFIDFSVDPEFSYCIDGLMMVDLMHIKQSKQKRYLQNTFLSN